MLSRPDVQKPAKVLKCHPDFNLLSCLLVLLLAFAPFVTKSQSDSSGFIFTGGLEEINQLDIEGAETEKISIASNFESNSYEAPGIISIITDKDIKNGGYRDITDLLNQIPGFSMATDVQNGVSFGVRGNWAEEAKLLIMIDGLPLNELAYGTYIFGQRIPLVNIDRIEIIRGAGSSQYGGSAALGVINIITKSGQDISGHRLMASGGQSNLAFSRTSISYNYGGVLPNGVELTTSGMINQGNLSNEKFRLTDSTMVNLRDTSYLIGANIYLTLKYKNIKFKQYYEDYNFQSTYEPVYSQNRTSITEFENRTRFKKADLIVSLNYKFQTPWNTQYGDPKIYDLQNLLANRLAVSFFAKTKLSKPYQFLAGVNAYNDNFRHHRAGLLLNSGKRRESYQGVSGFVESVYNTKYFIINAGGRLEQYAYFNANLAPRISVTKKFEYWHYKLIYNQAYKIPALQNINLDLEQTIRPEQLKELQAQTGFHYKKLNASATVFKSQIKNLIVFGYDLITFTESYINSGEVNTAGLELEAEYKTKKWNLNTNYSYHQILNSSAPEILSDSINPENRSLAFPAHKLVAKFSYFINAKMSAHAQYVFESSKSGFVGVNRTTGEFGLVEFPASHNLNLICNYDNLYKGTLDLSLGLYNVLATQLNYLYPFSSGYQPLRGMGRELLFNIKLKF